MHLSSFAFKLICFIVLFFKEQGVVSGNNLQLSIWFHLIMENYISNIKVKIHRNSDKGKRRKCSIFVLFHSFWVMMRGLLCELVL